MSQRRDLGALWHALIGLVLGALIAFGGWLREKIQHPDGELSRHQRLEAAAWGIGAVLGAAGFAAWVWFG